ncbi:threo-3-hydroxy-L-aspartate ammonia-lyase [Salisaeta longa]|uniref:threo-3-hydroxy-L-aspartate ammonia-lyase n=1 Tax=Salisaeta longa TaxID=503170 RepID=UPI0003B59443
MALPVTYDHVAQAAQRLDGIAHRTPVLTSRTLDARTQAAVALKCENFQRTGAFKIRGAYNALTRLVADTEATDVLTYSSGNHAQAVALAARELGVAAHIIMPENAPTVKLDATAGYGADIITYDPEATTREALADDVATTHGWPIIPPYDHPDVVAGQGTVGDELLTDVPELDMLLVCCGGGGLLSGCAIAAKERAPGCTVIGVEPARADDATRSFHTGRLHTVHNPDTIADGARTPSLGEVTFPLVQAHVDDMVTVSEAAIKRAMYFLWTRMKLVVEPTGALATAALLSGAVGAPGQTVGAIISGGNVDMARAAALFEDV